MSRVTLLVPTAALALAGCAHDPTVAAKVAGQSVPVSDVKVMATFLCATAQSGSGQVVPLSAVNQAAVTYLVGAKAVEAIARANGVTMPVVTGDSADIVAALPKEQQPRAQQLIDEVVAALKVTGGQTQQQAQATLIAAIQAEAAKGQVTQNPAYPTTVSQDPGSLSTAVSAIAQNAAGTSSDQQASTDYLAALPAGQKCS